MPYNKTAFTILELIVVIIIVGVLTSLALPRFLKLIEGSRATEALTNISALRQAVERCYVMNNGSYENCNMDWWGTTNTLDMETPANSPNSHFMYNVRGERWPHPWYSITAARNGRDGNQYYNHSIIVGYGIVPNCRTDTSFNYSSYANDDSLHWAASSTYRGMIPQ
jgi:prepilin-type N-terminal cleavage/methylation domain-containing protein